MQLSELGHRGENENGSKWNSKISQRTGCQNKFPHPRHRKSCEKYNSNLLGRVFMFVVLRDCFSSRMFYWLGAFFNFLRN